MPSTEKKPLQTRSESETLFHMFLTTSTKDKARHYYEFTVKWEEPDQKNGKVKVEKRESKI